MYLPSYKLKSIYLELLAEEALEIDESYSSYSFMKISRRDMIEKLYKIMSKHISIIQNNCRITICHYFIDDIRIECDTARGKQVLYEKEINNIEIETEKYFVDKDSKVRKPV
jgi:hypothetical protein